MKKIVKLTVMGTSFLFFTLQFQNCSQFGVDQSAKFELISKVSVFENGLEFPTGNERFDEGFSWTEGIETFDGISSNVSQNDGNLAGTPNYDGGGSIPPVLQDDGGGNRPSSPISEVSRDMTFISFPPNGGGPTTDNLTNGNMPVTQQVQSPGMNGAPGTLDINGAPRTPSKFAAGERVQFNQLPVVRVCSDMTITRTRRSSNKISRTPLALASSLELIITDMNQNTLCQITNTTAIRNQIIFNGAVDLSQCQQKVVSPFLVSLYADGNKANNLLGKVRQHFENGFEQPRKVSGKDAKQGIDLLYNENVGKSVISFKNFLAQEYFDTCDKHDSPLFIDFRSQEEQINGYTLSAPEDGVLFDIQGEKALPTPHTLKRISWFNDQRMAFIALPDKYGQVKGIDQLFGDNTAGPDGKFAANGFAALSKFDGLAFSKINDPKDLVRTYDRMRRVPDGKIDENDDIYHKLKLWKDLNSNGIGEPNELVGLKDSGVAIIDLIYDRNFKEKDEYGNIVKYKSVVKLTNGDYRLVFDIWFRTVGNNLN